ncbi:MAG: immunoglobulin domain-containing protein [Phycisphaerales bacterium]|jgi:hypothetical protein|nr:immunoglobulin domain-containing protein [Phycisphaerales bacterium]
MTLSFRRCSAAAILLALAGAAHGQTLVGASTTVSGQSTLMVVDPATGATTPFMQVPVPTGYEIRAMASLPGCRLAGLVYSPGDGANGSARLLIIDPAAGTHVFHDFTAPLTTSYCEGMDWSPRHDSLMVSYGPKGNFGTVRLALVTETGVVSQFSGALPVGDLDTIASSATLDLLMDLNRTTTPRIYNLSSIFPSPGVTAYASPPSIADWQDATIHPTTGDVILTTGPGNQLTQIVGNTYVNLSLVQNYNLRGLTWCSLPAVITSQPSNTIICPGGVATISVSHVGTGPFDYQWYENGSPIDTNDNPSAATANLSITTLSCISDQASYYCVITGPCAEVTTDTATLRACFADFNCDGFVNGDDYDAFASLFEPGDAGADLNCDSFVNGDDYDLFASAFESGC